MGTADDSFLTERQVEIFELREEGLTQQAIAERIGTTDSNVSAIERAARENIRKARRTLELVRSIRSPGTVTVEAGRSFDELVERIYESGDETGIKIAHPRPELYGRLYDALEPYTDGNLLETAVEVDITNGGEVNVVVPDTQ